MGEQHVARARRAPRPGVDAHAQVGGPVRDFDCPAEREFAAQEQAAGPHAHQGPSLRAGGQAGDVQYPRESAHAAGEPQLLQIALRVYDVREGRRRRLRKGHVRRALGLAWRHDALVGVDLSPEAVYAAFVRGTGDRPVESRRLAVSESHGRFVCPLRLRACPVVALARAVRGRFGGIRAVVRPQRFNDLWGLLRQTFNGQRLLQHRAPGAPGGRAKSD
mmetsp:Transcript_31699/g.106789  ORF Transcript_31699/g.106789 Transcript_31699/m.106789 type:complete len:219 (+) Transcript_31699:177-833(+)